MTIQLTKIKAIEINEKELNELNNSNKYFKYFVNYDEMKLMTASAEQPYNVDRMSKIPVAMGIGKNHPEYMESIKNGYEPVTTEEIEREIREHYITYSKLQKIDKDWIKIGYKDGKHFLRACCGI